MQKIFYPFQKMADGKCRYVKLDAMGSYWAKYSVNVYKSSANKLTPECSHL